MELAIVFVLVTSFIGNINSHPKNSDIIPKEYYKRQILQPIPGYIPVYIKADGEPLVRTESKKPVANVHSQKAAELKEKNLSKQAAKKTLLEDEGEKSENTESGVQNPQITQDKVQEKHDLTKARLKQNEDAHKIEKKIAPSKLVS